MFPVTRQKDEHITLELATLEKIQSAQAKLVTRYFAEPSPLPGTAVVENKLIKKSDFTRNLFKFLEGNGVQSSWRVGRVVYGSSLEN